MSSRRRKKKKKKVKKKEEEEDFFFNIFVGSKVIISENSRHIDVYTVTQERNRIFRDLETKSEHKVGH